MKTIHIDFFRHLVENPECWVSQVECTPTKHFLKREVFYNALDKSFELVAIPYNWGVAKKTHKYEDIVITYTENYSHSRYDKHTLFTYKNVEEPLWEIEGLRVVNDNGDQYDTEEVCCGLGPKFTEIDYSVLNIGEVTHLDSCPAVDGKEVFILFFTNKPRIRFTGELLASVLNTQETKLDGPPGQWTELFLYKNIDGKYICHQIARTVWPGEGDKFLGRVCNSIEEVKEYFGYSKLAQQLYRNAGIAG